ncbi:response regulator [Fibrella forsythiae]|uniref:Response regulator n=1 Tax=Fibrella forsythiae TaxID=2817061 RepID=A0ABS3JSF1_9BACT|nr:response regulator [Fibrella forsythiae]MBO0952950.1 response regulator [Fibrella forsythiae]
MMATNGQHIYLVDDDEDDQFLLQGLIKAHSPATSVQVLGDGEQLLKALEAAESLPTLVLLDLNMPRMNGMEALERIRTSKAYANLRVIILTTSDSEQDRQAALRLRASDYLIKPGSHHQMNQLVSAIKHSWL